MLIDTNEYIHRVNGIPLYYNGITSFLPHHPRHYELQSPEASPPYTNYDFLMSKLTSNQPSSSPITLTPPISPVPDQSRRSSVIMKVENCQIIPANESNESQLISIEHVCRWEGCYRIFETLEKLANHVSIAHSSVGVNNLYYCKWEGCTRSDRGFNARYKMLVHCRTHTKEKPHFCTYSGCSKAFSRAENLKIHVRSHTLEKPYRCNYPGCQKAYSNSSDRFKHSRTHQNNKPYMCKIVGCLKRYTDPSSLRKHIKTFNHENLSQSQKQSDESMDCDLSSVIRHDTNHQPDNIYFNENNKYVKHIEPSDEICCWMTKDDIADKLDSIKLDQPLDLSIKNNR